MKIFVFLLLILVGCSKDFTNPNDLAQHYIKEVTSKNLSLEFYEKYTTGTLWERVSGMSEEDFDLYQKSSRANVTDIEIVNENCLGDVCNLTIILKYSTVNTKDEKVISEVKKIVELQKDGEHWKVSQLSNIRTFHESKSPIHVESK